MSCMYFPGHCTFWPSCFGWNNGIPSSNFWILRVLRECWWIIWRLWLLHLLDTKPGTSCESSVRDDSVMEKGQWTWAQHVQHVEVDIAQDSFICHGSSLQRWWRWSRWWRLLMAWGWRYRCYESHGNCASRKQIHGFFCDSHIFQEDVVLGMASAGTGDCQHLYP